MPIHVTVTDLDAGGAPWQAVLPEPLATIGRSPTSDLVLQDPDKHVSRLHATIEQRADGHYLVVHSKVNPIMVDGVASPPGASVALRDGACVCMHPFELVVRIERAAGRPAAAGGDSFAWLGDAEARAGAGAGVADPFGLNHAVRQPPPSALPPDLFRREPAPPQAGLGAGIGGADARGFSAPPSLDPLALLNAGAASLGRAPGAQPLSLDALLGTAGAGAGTPLVDFGGHQRAPGASAALDHVHDFNLPFTAAPAAAPPPADPIDAALDWLNELAPPPAPPSPAAAVAPAGVPASVPTATAPITPAASVAPPPVPAANGAGAAAFLRGLGSAGIRIAPEQEEAFLERAGAVVQVAVQGLVTLLLARGEIKKELRAEERTMLASRANNPLKFMGSADEALRFLFSPNAGNAAAFLAPATAIEDACDELVAHELALVAGMRAAVIGAIKRFDPVTLEQKCGKGGALIAMQRKAKLWESYVEQYAQIERDMADNLDRLFERDFLGAYTDQVRRMGKQ